MLLYIAIAGLFLLLVAATTYSALKCREAQSSVAAIRSEAEEQRAASLAEVEAAKKESASRIATVQREAEKRISGIQQEAERGWAASRAEVEAAQEETERVRAACRDKVEVARATVAKLAPYRDIPDIFEKVKRTQEEIAVRLEQAREKADSIVLAATFEADRLLESSAAKLKEAQRRADEILLEATIQANDHSRSLKAKSEAALSQANEALRVARWQTANVLEEARKQAKEIASQARKEAKEKTQRVEETLTRATAFALDVRHRAEEREREIMGEAYESLERQRRHEAADQAVQNLANRYAGSYMVPAAHLLDEMAEEYGFHEAGERLKLARQRTSIMEKNGTAATCNYSEGWKRDYAINFVLSAFNGKVDSILARIKPTSQGKLIQEIKDTFALVNHNGAVFRNARIQDEFLNARLEELKWGVAVQRLKEKEREEQRALRERIREEEKARKEYERAIRQAQRDEEMLAKALEKARRAYSEASQEERTAYEARLQDLAIKLQEAEQRNQRALSMAQQTKAGYVYIISNVGSFGENVYKIGLTRRLEPMDRIRELGDASVPFGFDVHALIDSTDAPALEAALHKRFLIHQVNKVNRRKEFFRVDLQDIRRAAEEMKLDVKWTILAEATDYRETLALEKRMEEDPEFRARWIAERSAYEALRAITADKDDGEIQDGEVPNPDEADDSEMPPVEVSEAVE